MDTASTGSEFLRGVNFGGWLVLERWIVPSVFESTTATDEYTFMQTAGAVEKLDRHRQHFITKDDFRWLADHGVNAVRIPIGYWILDGDGLFQPGIEYLDWAIAMAEKYQLRVLIDLHGAKGSQNGRDHSGKIGSSDWYRYPQYQNQTISVLERLAERYHSSTAVWGIELLNEPKSGFLQRKLRRFYKEAYERLRAVARPETHIVFHDAFRPRMLSGTLRGTNEYPVVMDVHWYQFVEPFQGWRRLENYFHRLCRRSGLVFSLQKRQPIIVGEWSIVIGKEMLRKYSADEQEGVLRRHGHAQLDVYSQTAGWFYWTYKTERRDDWNFRALVEDGRLRLQ